MRYQRPDSGDFKDGMTSQTMYKTVDDLVRLHHVIPQSEPAEKLWHHPEVRRELTEFVDSYFLTRLPHYLPDIKDLFRHDGQSMNVRTYMIQLENDPAYRGTSLIVLNKNIEAIWQRAMHLTAQIKGIPNIEGKERIKADAMDAFAHLSMPYLTAEFIFREK